ERQVHRAGHCRSAESAVHMRRPAQFCRNARRGILLPAQPHGSALDSGRGGGSALRGCHENNCANVDVARFEVGQAILPADALSSASKPAEKPATAKIGCPTRLKDEECHSSNISRIRWRGWKPRPARKLRNSTATLWRTWTGRSPRRMPKRANLPIN